MSRGCAGGVPHRAGGCSGGGVTRVEYFNPSFRLNGLYVVAAVVVVVVVGRRGEQTWASVEKGGGVRVVRAFRSCGTGQFTKHTVGT